MYRKQLLAGAAFAGALLAASWSNVFSAAEPAAADAPTPTSTDTAIFAGGCFWCMEPPFEKLDGVLDVESGYTGGQLANPGYKQVSAGGTGHAEAVRIRFDPSRISYAQLLQVFWHNIDPTVKDQQFCDHGNQYRSAIFYRTDAQQATALDSLERMKRDKPFAAPIVTEVTRAGEFYPAEEYHQDYYLKNPLRYRFYRYSCGRDQRLEELWGSSGH